ncbi:MAG: hypothetical protein AAB339_06060, partial [Elusimicrobiota bacterium]
MGRISLGFALLLFRAGACNASPLEGLLWSKLSEEQAESLGEDATAERAVKLMSPAQREEVRSGLSYLERSEELDTLKEAGRGYLLLGYAGDAARVAAKLRELEPTDPRGHSLAAQSAYAGGDYDEAARFARGALLLDKKDGSMKVLLRLAQGKAGRSSGRGALAPAARERRSLRAAPAPGEAEFSGKAPLYGKVLDKRERLRVDRALNRLFRTGKGRQYIKRIAEDADGGVTLSALKENGVDVRSGHDLGEEGQRVEKEGEVYVILLAPEALSDKQGVAEPVLGAGLSEAGDRKEYEDWFPALLIKQKAALVRIWIAEELFRDGEGCSDDSRLCEAIRLGVRIWKDDLANKPMDEDEFKNDDLAQQFEIARQDDLKGRYGTKEVL